MKQVEAIEAVAYDASMALTNWRLDASGQIFWARLYKTGPELVQELREVRKAGKTKSRANLASR